MSLKTFKQDPTARLDYPIDWNAPASEGGPYLEAGDSIATATATIDGTPAGIAIDGDVELNGDVTIIWIATTGAAPGTYVASVHIVTAMLREDDRSIKIIVAEQ